jgi:hypothetical protein
MKTSEILLFSAIGLGAVYIFGKSTGEALPGAAVAEAKKQIDAVITSVSTSASNYANVQAEAWFYNNPYTAGLAGHPEWAYMTPAKGYF